MKSPGFIDCWDGDCLMNIQGIYDKLYDRYGPQNWWPAETPFEMMVGAILVQNTNWRNVDKALLKVGPYLTPEGIESMPTDQLAALIRSSGFFNIKAKRIKAYLAWFKTYDYDVNKVKKMDQQQLRSDLLHVHGVGRETADVLLLYAFEKPVFVVDAYVRRIFYRLGFDMPTSYDAFRKLIESKFTGDVACYNEYHALLVEHAKVHCKATPICERCPLFTMCERRID